MSSYLSVNGAVATPIWTDQASVRADHISTSAPAVKSRSSVDIVTDDGSVDVQTATDLRRAEHQGKHVSIGQEQLIKQIEQAVKAVQGYMTSLEFSVHEKTHQVMVKVLNRDTGEVIREIPPEKIADLVAKLWEMAGILVDERR